TNGTASTITGTGSPFLIVDSGKTNTIGTNVTVTFSGSARINPNATASGTLIIENGAIVQQSGAASPLTLSGSNTVVSVKTGGIFRNNQNASGSAYMSIGSVDGDDATLSVDGGTVTIARNNASFWVPTTPAQTAGNIKGTITINAGTLKNNVVGA